MPRHEPPHEDGNGFTLSVPGGFKLAGRGMVALVALVIALLAGALAALLYVGYGKAAAMEEQHKDIGAWLEALVYVSLLPESEKEHLLNSMKTPSVLRGLVPPRRYLGGRDE